jgi:hypothetical protein
MTGKDDGPFESALVAFSVTNARAISGKTLFALVDVEMQIAGVCFAILGVTTRFVQNRTLKELSDCGCHSGCA